MTTRKAIEMPMISSATSETATAIPPTEDVTDTAGLNSIQFKNTRSVSNGAHVKIPSANVKAVPNKVQTNKGHLNLTNLPNLFFSSIANTSPSSVVKVVSDLPSSLDSLRGNKAIYRANGPPSPSPVPNSKAKTTYTLLSTPVFISNFG